MPKKSNRYRGAAQRAERRGKNAPLPSGQMHWLRRATGAIRARIHRPHPRREAVVIGALALAIVVGLGSLGGAYLLYKSNHDWTSVASVNGHSISREALRGRMAVLSLLAGERSNFVTEAVNAGQLDTSEATTLQNQAAAATSLEAARDSLINDELLRQLAARDGVATPASPDPWAEATAYAASDLAHRLRSIRFGLPPATSTTTPTAPEGWPVASAASVDATTALVRSVLVANTPAEAIVAHLHDAGWQVFGEDVAVSDEGVPADPALELDRSVAAATMRGNPGAIVGPVTDAYGRVSIGKLLAPLDPSGVSHRLPFDADKAGLDTAALQSWADGRALRRAVTQKLLDGWAKGVNQAHFRELVVGPASDSSGTAGPWVELSALALDRLNGVSPSSIAGAPAGLDLGPDALARTLRAMATADRESLFRRLVAAANAASPSGTTGTSGELGFYTKDGLLPDLSKAAFDAGVRFGDVVGPISTSAGPELFLVEARYSGALDERAKAALGQVRADPAPDPLAYTEKFSPNDVPLATDAGWRAEAEFGADEPVRTALFDTALGALSDPFVLDGNLALAIVTERRTAVPDARMLDRLALDGYAAWFGSEYAKAAIIRADSPLPELMPSSSPSPTSSLPVLPSAPNLNTPGLPTIPGQPAATPVKTDELGLPVLP